MRKYSILFLLFAIAFIGCENEFDQRPSSSLPSTDATPNMATFNTAVNGVYSTLISRWSFLGDQGLYADAKGGDIKLIDNSVNHFQPVLIYQTDKNSGLSIGSYQVFSYLTTRANSVMESAQNVEDKDDNIDQYNDYMGQLYALRALGHFEMARMYCKIPVIAEDINASNSGIPLNDKVYEYNTKFTRSTLKQTYDFIISDFVRSLELLSKGKKEGSGKINYWAVEALLSRAYLYMGDYNNALKYANDVIENSPYKLYTLENYLSVWKLAGTDESLFEITTTDNTNAQRNSLGYYTNPDGYPEAGASDAFMTFINEQTGDIRTQTVKEKSQSDGKRKGFYTTKYEGQEGSSTPLYTNNCKVIRLSEVYLIAAEAKLLGGNTAGSKEAAWYYNELRRNRIQDYIDVENITIDNILDERRIEFFCENHRMFDLVRHKSSIYSQQINATLEYNDTRLLTAIPEREINISPELVQNPGW
jgi:hypothetical protein